MSNENTDCQLVTFAIRDDSGVIWSSSDPQAREEGNRLLNAVRDGNRNSFADKLGTAFHGNVILSEELAHVESPFQAPKIKAYFLVTKQACCDIDDGDVTDEVLGGLSTYEANTEAEVNAYWEGMSNESDCVMYLAPGSPELEMIQRKLNESKPNRAEAPASDSFAGSLGAI